MLDVFWQEIYPELDTSNTGVLVVANINPYGMKNHRRYNENNVDLNRNFIMDWDSFDVSVCQVADMDVISNACSIFCRIVSSKYGDRFA